MTSKLRFGVVSEPVLAGPDMRRWAWPSSPPGSGSTGDPLDLLPAALDQKIAVLRERAGDRFPALSL